MTSQSYCMDREFAFKDKENKNRETKLSAHNKDQTLSRFCTSFFTTAHTANAQASRPPVTPS